jgi:HPt (histidine-containing phosphotransfer) domain-containing protein
VLDRELMIIALTANASEEDRARYLAAGMDDFLTKPINEDALHQQLSRAIERQLARGIAMTPMAPEVDDTITIADLDAMFGVTTVQAPPSSSLTAAMPARSPKSARAADLHARMHAAFADDLPARRAELDNALARRDHDAAARVLHGLKGSAAHLGEPELQRLAGELEVAADQRQWQRLELELADLYALLDRFDSTRPA